ncbi:Radical SAM domain protein [Paramagnetospirillum magnetotacticum MS-1]|uniref:Radical SAM domain protein n=1 Tax=Paramagnetospirillum magnetotacticum MS-1 TaxID=272627 RepID=A0A0C2YSN2_PARME|nr:radical SAM protein [Paramagnetospirillum magnetotacticum]KIL97730.1 Radical SAM domain protein [Paramagnetospirillum magnetotacticum MS-1]
MTESHKSERIRPLVQVIGEVPASTGPKAKVALVRGPVVMTANALNNEAVPALGLAYVAGFLRAHGYDPLFLDGIAEGLNRTYPLDNYPGYWAQGLTIDEIVARIPEDTEVIGFSVMFSGEWPVQRDLIRAVRIRFPHAFLVGGGEHITALTEYSIRDSGLDACVLGEGEFTFYRLLEARSAGEDLSVVGSIAYLDAEGRFVVTSEPTRVRDIDNIPWPWWPEGYLEGFWTAGKSYGVQTARDMPMMISRGCPFQCTFCSNPRMWTTRYSLRAVDDVIAEMKHYIAHYGATAFQLYDLTAIVKKDWAVDLCQRMIDEGIAVKWSLPSGTRSEALDEEVLTLLRQTGCNYLVYAPESGSPRTLERIKKKISLDKLTESALIAKKVGLVIRCNLIIGFPHETRRDVFDTVRYGLYLAFKGADEVSINIFSPYPGSELFRELDEAGRMIVNDGYFLSLTSLNSDYTRFNPLTFNTNMGAAELALYRITFMLGNYIVGYLRHPSRIWRTIRNAFLGKGTSTTVLEHRLKDAMARRRARKQAERG